jgi:5'-3' exonuclease
MGVPGFFAWLQKTNRKNKNLIVEDVNKKVKYLMLDTNCLLHPCVGHILDKYNKGDLTLEKNRGIREQLEELIWEKIQFNINDMIMRLNPEIVYIAIDGVAPMGKILQQRQRRYKYIFDKDIKLPNVVLNKSNDSTEVKETNELVELIEYIREDGIYVNKFPISSIELTPGTDYMERIHKCMIEYIKKLNVRCLYSSYHEPGEGEHKILQYIKKNINPEDSIVIYGLDADLLFLALSTGIEYKLYIMREKQFFNDTKLDLDDYIDYNYVEIAELRLVIENLNININDFIFCCYLVGNDFIPGLLTTDIKKFGLDKILDAYKKTIESAVKKAQIVEIINDNGKKIVKVHHNILRELFKNLLWTEKWIWSNINREKSKNILENKEDIEKFQAITREKKISNLNNFACGLSINVDCFDKIEFGSSLEYYNYYLGLNEIALDTVIIKKMVKEYIKGIEWCINYYLDDCICWKWGYNFPIAPLIIDIIKYYPSNPTQNLSKCELRPIEQLILAIPPSTYKYVIKSDLIKKFQKNLRIGYMFPESFDIDINKESLYWKCPVKIPMVEYEEYINVIKSFNIDESNNLLDITIKNY